MSMLITLTTVLRWEDSQVRKCKIVFQTLLEQWYTLLKGLQFNPLAVKNYWPVTLLTFISYSYNSYADETQLIQSFSQSVSRDQGPISACLGNISQLMSTHHLKLNLDKTALPSRKGFLSTTSLSIQTALDGLLSFPANIVATTLSCSLMLYNIRKIHLYPFWLVCLHKPVVPCSSSRIGQGGL